MGIIKKLVAWNSKGHVTKTITMGGLLCIFVALFFSATWVNKNLYIREVVKEALPISEEKPATEKEEIKVFEQVTTDQMLSYLKEKYGVEFKSLDYKTGAIFEKESMSVYPKYGSDLFDIVKITRNQDGTYSDNYLEVYSKTKVKEEIKIRLDNNIKTKKLHKYLNVKVTSVDAQSLNEIDKTDIKYLDVHAVVTILLDANEVSQNAMNPLKDIIVQELTALNINADTLVVNAINVDKWDNLTDNTFALYNTSTYIRQVDSNDN